jgi:queuine tRNA-ribosyltransferase
MKNIMSNFFLFSIDKKIKNSTSRIGKIITAHGIIETPCFVPVATNACIKSCFSHEIENLSDLIFCNTYHLMLHPGENTIESAGGLHKFMNRKKPIITDSGGFQIFSLKYGGVTQELKSMGLKKNINTIISSAEEGVVFRSYRDGSLIKMTPEISIQAQKKIGADIIITFDELLPYHIEKDEFTSSFYKTHRWQIRSIEEHKKNIKNQAIYCVIHGSIYEDFRKLSCEILKKHDFDGYAIGGSLGTCTSDVLNVLKSTISNLEEEKPRHLLGIADLETIKEAINMGIDTFDSSYPTKCARHGLLFTENGNIKIGQSKWKNYHETILESPIFPYKISYLHHLFKAREATYAHLASLHNIWFLNQFCKKIINKI